MKKQALKRIFEFLEEKGNNNIPFKWKLINNEPLTKEDLNVKGDLNLSGRNITSLPEGLEVDGSIYFNQSTIKSLPKGLGVGGFIFIRNTPLTKYSDNQLREMIKPGFIKGKVIR